MASTKPLRLRPLGIAIVLAVLGVGLGDLLVVVSRSLNVLLPAAIVVGLTLVVGARLAAADKQWLSGAVLSGLLTAALLGFNLPVLHWLVVEPRGFLSASEFSWFLPVYLNVVVVFGALCVAVFTAAIVRTSQ